MEFYNDHEPARRQPHADARLYARIGLAGPAPLRVLEPGESAITPQVHFGFVYGDLDACVQALHVHERRSVVPAEPAGKEQLVELNHTGYTRNLQVTAWQLHQEIDLAADIGIELFMLDAGWFGEVSDQWFRAVGDWDRESPLLQPEGVKGVFDYAHARGLQVGLWVEAERMGDQSHLLRDHPDWQMEKRGQKIPNLDLSKPEVAQHLQDTVSGIIERYGLDCYRLDYNITIGEGGEAQRGGFTENVLWRHYEALYRAFDRIRECFPHLLFENCSSGGGRNDLGIMQRFHFTQLTDKWSPSLQLKILNGMTVALAPEMCEVHLGAINDGLVDIDFMLRIGLFGHMDLTGIFPSMDERQAAAREHWRHAVDLYKSFVRPMLATCRVYHHTPIQHQTEPGDWVVLEYASPDARRAYAGIFRLGASGENAYRLYPRGIDAGRRYRVTYDTAGQTREVDGGTLLDQGLRVSVAGPYTSELLLFEAI
jgi:alpha-galactosidase